MLSFCVGLELDSRRQIADNFFVPLGGLVTKLKSCKSVCLNGLGAIMVLALIKKKNWRAGARGKIFFQKMAASYGD